MKSSPDLRQKLTIVRGAIFVPLLFSYVAASYLIFSIPSKAILSSANFLFPLWNTGYSVNIDIEAGFMILSIVALTYISNRHQGKLVAGLHTLRYTAISIFPLGLMILLSPAGYGFFFVRVSNVQAKFLPWTEGFTNEDLFIVSVLLFVVTTIALRQLSERGAA